MKIIDEVFRVAVILQNVEKEGGWEENIGFFRWANRVMSDGASLMPTYVMRLTAFQNK